jgi:glycerol-3-phosphate dehydrogenase
MKRSIIRCRRGPRRFCTAKLTTFRLIALDALKVASHRLPDMGKVADDLPVLDPIDVPLSSQLFASEESTQRRLLGRYGADGPALVAAAEPGELTAIPGTNALWAELRWAARAEGVVHLDDLLLRRVRLGLLLPKGGQDLRPRVRAICQPELGWDDSRWEVQEATYLALWQAHYSLP